MSYAKALPTLLAVLLASCMMEPEVTGDVFGPAIYESSERLTEEIGESSSAVVRLPPRNRCTAHYTACMMSDLGSIWDGPNSTRCHTCMRFCQGQGKWPDRMPAGDTCEWWRYIDRPWPR